MYINIAVLILWLQGGEGEAGSDGANGAAVSLATL